MDRSLEFYEQQLEPYDRRHIAMRKEADKLRLWKASAEKLFRDMKGWTYDSRDIGFITTRIDGFLKE